MPTHPIPPRETLEVEFKSDRDCLSDDDLIEALICLANAQGGTLYLGVENDGTATGLHKSRQVDIGGLSALVAHRTAPSLQVRVECLVLQPGRVAAISVQRSPEIVARSDGLVKRRRMDAHGRQSACRFYRTNTPAAGPTFRCLTCRLKSWLKPPWPTSTPYSASACAQSSPTTRVATNRWWA